jgi:hypothetical protein
VGRSARHPQRRGQLPRPRPEHHVRRSQALSPHPGGSAQRLPVRTHVPQREEHLAVLRSPHG